MTHITFYRKYRSQTFSELEGQNHIIQTLSNAIQFNRLAHAYIFSGPRGTGKTSTARILAKALNCRNGQSITPCMTCDLCQKVTAGQCVDVIEIDAASNTGVDNIRALNEQVNFTPIEGKYKIYIIDEVHMLSSGAFNALLKTLEEPPAFTLFILATTESHKIPPTILSRCQHLHFRKLNTAEIVAQLQKIAETEGLTVSQDSLALIARQSAGCMRDAVSLLDQVFSFKGTTIEESDIIFMLGGNTFDNTLDLVKFLLQKDSVQTLSFIKTFFLGGGNILQLIQDLTSVFKHLMYLHLKLDNHIELDQGRLTKLKELSQTLAFTQITTWMEQCAKLESELRWFPNPELLLEVRILTWLHPQSDQVSAPKPAPAKSASPSPAPTPRPMQAPSSPSLSPSPLPSSPPTADASLQGQWEKAIQLIKAQKQPLFSILDKSQALSLEGNELHVRLRQDFKFFRDKLTEDQSRTLINQSLTEVFGKPITLGFGGQTTASPAPQEASPPLSPLPTPTPSSPPPPQPVGSQKLNQIVALFEGKVV